MRRAKKKNNFKIWLPIICIIVVGITFFMINDMENKIEQRDTQNATNEIENVEEKETDDTEQVVEENTIENNVINETEAENTVEKEENISTNVTNSNTAQNVQTTNKPVAEAKPAVTDKKQKAIDLVKEMWGQDDSVNYSFEYINENGEYVVAVRDGASATVKNYFRVNLDTEEVEMD